MDTKAIREKAAKQDMALARKHGEVTVCQTLVGNVALRYGRGTCNYTLVKQVTWKDGPEAQPQVLASGTGKKVLPALAALYDVVVES